MSGGSLEYGQLSFLIEDLKRYKNDYGEDSQRRFRNAIRALELAEIYVRRIDFLVSGDDSEDTFHQRLRDELTDKLGDLFGR